LFAKAREETALDGSRKALVPGAQLGESVVQIEEPLGLGITTDTLLVEGHGHHPSAALRRETSARTAYDHLAHGAGCDSEKVASVFHTHAFLVRELEIGFADESRRVECCSSVGTAKMVARDAAKLIIDERHELIEGLAISACIGLKKIGDGVRFSHVSHGRGAENIARMSALARARANCYHPRMLHAILLLSLLKTSDPRAIEVADQMMAALGGQSNWDEARFIRFTNVRRNRKATFTWDRQLGRLRLEARNASGVPYVVLMNLNARQGSVYVEGRQLHGKERSEYVNRSARMWTGATYWFLMPFKWKDPGVILAYDGEESIGSITYDRIHLSFANVGRSPGDQYWAYVNRETHLMDRWKFKLEGGAEGEYRWTNWHRYGGIRVATERVSVDEVIRFEDIVVASSMPDEFFFSPAPIELR